MPKMLRYIDERKCDGATVHRSIKFNGDDVRNIEHVDVSPYADKMIPFFFSTVKRQRIRAPPS